MNLSETQKNFEDLNGRFSVNYSDTKTTLKKDPHIHSAYEVTLILSDGVSLDVNNESYPVPYGSLLIFNTMDLHRISYHGNDSYKRWVIWFKNEFLSEFGDMYYSLLRCFFARGFDKANMLTLSKERIDILTDICTRLKAASENDGYMSVELTKMILGELLINVNEWYLFSNFPHLDKISGGVNHVYDAILYIQENFSQRITRETLTKVTGIDERTLCESFKAVTGQTTTQYILNVRINSAKAYLIKGMSVTEVCEKTAFENWSNFSRTFRNHVGMSPKQYAMQFRRI